MVDSVDRFKEDRVLERLWEAFGRSREDTEVGKGDSRAIALWTSKMVRHKQWFTNI